MGFSLSDIFGGGSESTTNPAKVWEEQVPFLQDLYQRAQMQSYGGMGQNYANQVNQSAMGGLQNQMAGGYQNPQLMQGLQNFGGMQNQALGGAIQAGLGDINRNFQNNIMPSINTGSAMTNTSGGSRQGIAQGIAAGEANRQAGDFVARMQSNNFQNMMQNQLGAYNQMGGLQAQQNMAQQGALGMAPQMSNLGFGSQYGNLAALSSLLGGPTVLGGGSSGSSQGGIGSSLGGGAALFSVLSDRRAKENIKRVGKTDSGLNVYTYNYKGHPMTQMGVMAQEVEEVMPDAVHEFNGLKTVDYTKVI